MNKRNLSFANAINESIFQNMQENKNVIIMGEGVGDPKEIFGTTNNLIKKFPKRVFDMPLSELAATGVIIGCSLNKLRPILVHQRVDFSLLALDQVINLAAKLHYISNGEHKVPIVIRMIVGRGWGQSAQHSQSLEVLYSHIPGLKVVIPFNAYEAKGLMSSAILDNNPTIFIEHRWLYDNYSNVPKKNYKLKLDSTSILKKGSDLTIVASSLLTTYALKIFYFFKKFNIGIEIINLKVTRPLNVNEIVKSLKKTKKLLILDSGMTEYGISSEIIVKTKEKLNNNFKFLRLGTKNYPTPVSSSLIKGYYPDIIEIIRNVIKILNKQKLKKNIKFKIELTNIKKLFSKNLDTPNKEFKGPF